MTLNFSETASGCAEARLLYPAISTHLYFEYGALKRRDTDFADPRIPAGAVLDDLLHYLLDEGFIPDGRYWARTVLRDWESRIRRGKSCLCGDTCWYPEAP